MSSKEIDLSKLDKRYIVALLEALEKRKKTNAVDPILYGSLKEKYSIAYEAAEDKSIIREGFVTLEAIAPDPDTIRQSVILLLVRIKDISKEQKKVEERFAKLDDLLLKRKISEAVMISKKKEYEILLSKYEDQKNVYINAIPDTLAIIQEINAGIVERLEDLEAEKAINPTKAIGAEKKRLTNIKKEIASAAKDLSKLTGTAFQMADWERSQVTPEPTEISVADVSTEFTPLQDEISQASPTIVVAPPEEPLRPPPRTTVWATWKDMRIGKLVGDVNIVGGSYAIIVTDRPSLAIIRDIALTGPSRLRTSTNPKVIEERLKKLIQDEYNIEAAKALHPEHLVKYVIDNKIGVDLFRLINSYYASVGRGAVTVQNNEATINETAQILTLAENVNMLGRRVLAPDRTLIGVIHELYYDPITSNLYAFAFKGVPPPIIRRIYQNSHNRSMTDNTFSDFRNEISKKLSIPIYEALTPSSIIRYSLMSGLIQNLNQLVTLVESMNPRITKAVDISSVTSQGILLSRFPQNALPKIELLEY